MRARAKVYAALVIGCDLVVASRRGRAHEDTMIAFRDRSLNSTNEIRMRMLAAASAMLCVFASSAEARTHHRYHPSCYRHYWHYSRAHAYSGRPAAWCGWYMRGQVGRDSGPQYNRAVSWARYGVNACGPSVGAIVVWRHHVARSSDRSGSGVFVRSPTAGPAAAPSSHSSSFEMVDDDANLIFQRAPVR